MIRWNCPNGLHPAELGPSRPPAEATVLLDGRTLDTLDELRGKAGAVARYREARRTFGASVRIARLDPRFGLAHGIFHGRKLVSWELPDGRTYPVEAR